MCHVFYNFPRPRPRGLFHIEFWILFLNISNWIYAYTSGFAAAHLRRAISGFVAARLRRSMTASPRFATAQYIRLRRVAPAALDKRLRHGATVVVLCGQFSWSYDFKWLRLSRTTHFSPNGQRTRFRTHTRFRKNHNFEIPFFACYSR